MTNDTRNDFGLAATIGNAAVNVLSNIERDWRQMCGPELRPSHVALDMLQMDDTLPHAIMLKRTGPGSSRIRVAGQKVHDLYRSDLAGRRFETLFGDATSETVAELVEAAFTLPAITSFGVQAQRSLGRRPVRGQVILLPMRDPLGDITRLLGAIVTDGTPCPRHLRFEIDNTQPIRCDAQTEVMMKASAVLRDDNSSATRNASSND